MTSLAFLFPGCQKKFSTFENHKLLIFIILQSLGSCFHPNSYSTVENDGDGYDEQHLMLPSVSSVLEMMQKSPTALDPLEEEDRLI